MISGITQGSKATLICVPSTNDVVVYDQLFTINTEQVAA
jgi:hypothetical protein